MISAAFRYARNGIAVFPCGGKIPIKGTRGVLDATTDVQQIREWWREHPTANVAIAAGASGLCVIDVDVKDVNGFESLHRCIRQLGPLPTTRVATTPSHGEHWYFRQPEGVVIRPSAGKLGPGLDVRAGASYCVAPPSPVYAWRVCDEAQLLPAPWADALRAEERRRQEPGPMPITERGEQRVEKYCLSALRSSCDGLIATPKGRRNATLWNTAAALGGLCHAGAFTADDVKESLLWACGHWETRTPYKDRGTIERGLAFGVEHPRRIDLGEDHDGQRSSAA